MAILTAHHTDKGIRKETNQDALLIKTASTSIGEVGLFVVCDGMGGLSQGELASATVTKGMLDWFNEKLPGLIFSENMSHSIVRSLEDHIKGLNEKIISYGESRQVKLGTTITAFLVIDLEYFILHIGDSRAYVVRDDLTQLTNDQTLVAREVAKGMITEEQAEVDPRRNVLLQCVGATKEIEVTITKGNIENGATYFLCSDGFHHQLEKNEIVEYLHPEIIQTEAQMKEKAEEMINLVKARQEKDNISILLFKIFKNE